MTQDKSTVAGLRMAIEVMGRIREDYPGNNRAYNRGARKALDEVERVLRKEIELLKEGVNV